MIHKLIFNGLVSVAKLEIFWKMHLFQRANITIISHGLAENFRESGTISFSLFIYLSSHGGRE